MNNHIVIMAGGVGSRFWPLSTPELLIYWAVVERLYSLQLTVSRVFAQ